MHQVYPTPLKSIDEGRGHVADISEIDDQKYRKH